TAASALTGSATAFTGRGCRPAAAVHPATISTGAAADETTPHHGTPRTINHRSWRHPHSSSSQTTAHRQPGRTHDPAPWSGRRHESVLMVRSTAVAALARDR